MDKITITNITDHNIGLIVPDLSLNRTIAPNRSIKINREVLEDALNYIGVERLVNSGFIRIEDEQILEDSGLAQDFQTEESKATFDELKEIINNGTDLQLKNAMSGLPKARLDIVVDAAIQCENLTMAKAELIKKYTGTDIFRLKSKMEE